MILLIDIPYKLCLFNKFLVKEKLAHDPDSEVATTSLRVSLLCPVSILIEEILMFMICLLFFFKVMFCQK